MAGSKSPQEAMNGIENIKNVVLILLVFGFSLLSWATMGYGLSLGSALWGCAWLLAAGYWTVCERFTAYPNRRLLAMMRAVTGAFVAVWIVAFAATIYHWGELSVAMIMALILAATLTALMLRTAILGRVSVGY